MNCKYCGKPITVIKKGKQRNYCDNENNCYSKWYREKLLKKNKIVLEEHSAIRDIEKRLKANQAEITRNVINFYKPVDQESGENFQLVYKQNLTEKKYPSVMAERIVI